MSEDIKKNQEIKWYDKWKTRLEPFTLPLFFWSRPIRLSGKSIKYYQTAELGRLVADIGLFTLFSGLYIFFGFFDYLNAVRIENELHTSQIYNATVKQYLDKLLKPTVKHIKTDKRIVYKQLKEDLESLKVKSNFMYVLQNSPSISKSSSTSSLLNIANSEEDKDIINKFKRYIIGYELIQLNEMRESLLKTDLNIKYLHITGGILSVIGFWLLFIGAPLVLFTAAVIKLTAVLLDSAVTLIYRPIRDSARNKEYTKLESARNFALETLLGINKKEKTWSSDKGTTEVIPDFLQKELNIDTPNKNISSVELDKPTKRKIENFVNKLKNDLENNASPIYNTYQKFKNSFNSQQITESQLKQMFLVSQIKNHNFLGSEDALDMANHSKLAMKKKAVEFTNYIKKEISQLPKYDQNDPEILDKYNAVQCLIGSAIRGNTISVQRGSNLIEVDPLVELQNLLNRRKNYPDKNNEIDIEINNVTSAMQNKMIDF